MVDVVAALIWDDNRFLICQRPENKVRALLWEFVGGKMEPGETKQQALVRECREELGVLISVGEVFTEVDHIYQDITIHLTFFHATIQTGRIQMLEHNDIRWITVDQIPDYDFCPADKIILEKLIRERSNVVKGIQQELISFADVSYKAFHEKLIPGICPSVVLGVRVPMLRKYAKKLTALQKSLFLRALPHTYYDENVLHGIILSECKDAEKLISLLDDFLPYVDNWAVCDVISPRCFRKNSDHVLDASYRWIRSDSCYTIRFGIGVLLKYYLDENYSTDFLNEVVSLKSDEYYVNMMRAWYFATALAKQYDDAVLVLREHTIDLWTHNKTIQKAMESFRICKERRQELRCLKRRA